MKKFMIVAKNDKYSFLKKEELLQKLTPFLQYDEVNPDLIISVGGDGTFLRAVHQYFHLTDQVSFLGVHTGTLGFYNDYNAEDIDLLVKNLIKNNFRQSCRRLLEVKTNTGESFYALNEARLETLLHTQTIDVYIDNLFFETFKGTGLCLSTQSGSTAYNRSLLGAVIDEELDILQLTEVSNTYNPQYHSLMSPLVLKGNRKIKLINKNFKKTDLVTDYLKFELPEVTEVEITLSDKSICLLQVQENNYLQKVKLLLQ